MTLFKLLLKSTGLSNSEVSKLLDVSLNTVKAWTRGKNPVPDRIIKELFELVDRQNRTAAKILKDNPNITKPELSYCADDDQAQELGYPTKSAHDAMLRRVIERGDPVTWEGVILSIYQS